MQFWFVISILAFMAAAGLVIAGRRAFFNWVLLVGTFGNLMIYRALFKNRSRAG